jgi:hypothetical protein
MRGEHEPEVRPGRNVRGKSCLGAEHRRKLAGHWFRFESIAALTAPVVKVTRGRQGTLAGAMYADAPGAGDAEKKQGAKRHN